MKKDSCYIRFIYYLVVGITWIKKKVLKSKTCAANTNETCFIKLTYMRPFLKAPSTSISVMPKLIC